MRRPLMLISTALWATTVMRTLQVSDWSLVQTVVATLALLGSFLPTPP